MPNLAQLIQQNRLFSVTQLILLTQFLIGVALIASPAQAQTPVGHWLFVEGSGTAATDASANGYTATLLNGVSWISGPTGNAVAANAANRQYVRTPPVDLSATKAVTVTLWVNRNYSTAGGHVLFEATADYGKSTTGFTLLPDDDACQGIQVGLRGDVGYASNCYSQPTSGVWHHLAVVFDKTLTGGNEVAFYVDGVLQNPSRNLWAATNTNNFGDDPVYLFARGGVAEFSSGTAADLRIYDRALSAAEIQQIYDGAALMGLSVTPTNAAIQVGGQQQLTATGTYRDGRRQDLTNSVTWITTAASVASISSRGLTTGKGAGSASINAVWGGISGSAGVTVTVPASTTDASSLGAQGVMAWQQGFDFRKTQDFVTDPSGYVYVLATTSYPTTYNGVTYGWTNTGLVRAVDRNATVDPRLAGINYAVNGKPTKFYVDLPSPGTYSIQLAMGDATAPQCQSLCQVQLLDGSTVVATITGGAIAGGYFYDAKGNKWSASQWPTNNQTQQVTLNGTRLTAVVGANFSFGSIPTVTPLACLGVTQVSNGADFTIAAAPTVVSVVQGSQGSSTITTTISGGFNNPIALSATGVPAGTTVSFSPNPIAAPGAGSSAMTITVGSSTPVGTYPLTVTGSGGGTQHSTTVTLTVTAPQVALSWTASITQVVGYNAYRSLTSGGPYTKLNASLVSNTTYTDLAVQHGYTYYYVATAVDSQGRESVYSNEAAATVP